MLRRPRPFGSGLRLCQCCALASGRQPVSPARQTLVAAQPAGHPAELSPSCFPWPISARSFTTSQSCPRGAKQPTHPPAQDVSQSRFGRTSAVPTYQAPGPDAATVLAAVDRVVRTFLGPVGIPSEAATLTALQALAQIEVRPPPDAAERRHDDVAAAETTRRPASQLLGLDGVTPKNADATRPQKSHSQRLQDVVDKVSDAAYTIVTQPTVVITRQILDEYVRLQARLGKPQSLPQILGLYASKPKPKIVSGTVQYVERNPSKIDSAVDPAVADVALDAAIEAKDLEAAIGVLETTYSAKAFSRYKLFKKALLPGFAVAGTPVALYLAATQLAQVQHALEPKFATGIALTGALCYVGFTGSIGLVAHFTANDQMKRVTWAPGTALRHRWLYEEERAALDKIACAFGFSEEHRWGEEEGEEFLWLREYILSRSMILDAVHLMPGMN